MLVTRGREPERVTGVRGGRLTNNISGAAKYQTCILSLDMRLNRAVLLVVLEYTRPFCSSPAGVETANAAHLSFQKELWLRTSCQGFLSWGEAWRQVQEWADSLCRVLVLRQECYYSSLIRGALQKHGRESYDLWRRALPTTCMGLRGGKV